MVARKLLGYVSKANKYNEQVEEWALDLGNGNAKCKICESNNMSASAINFFKGLQPLISHSETTKHVKNRRKYNAGKQQVNLMKSLQTNSTAKTVERLAKSFEIDFIRSADR